MGEWSQPTSADYARAQSSTNETAISRLTAEVESLKQRVTKLEARQPAQKKLSKN